MPLLLAASNRVELADLALAEVLGGPVRTSSACSAARALVAHEAVVWFNI